MESNNAKTGDLSTTHPKLSKEAFGWDPKGLTHGSKLKVDWKCSAGHIYSAQVVSRTLHKSGCPFCSGRKPIIGENDLETTHPDLAKEAFGWDPKEFKSGSHAMKPWKCKSGHLFDSKIESRTLKKSGCPFCSGRSAIVNVNDLQTLNPLLAKEAFGWDPKRYKTKSGKKLPWKCSKGHVWMSSPATRARGTGCPYCSNTKVVEGFNDLATTHPLIAMQANGWDPKCVLGGSSAKKSWKCSRQHTWEASLNSRTTSGVGCPYCSGNRTLAGFNDLQTLFPSLAKQAVGWDPSRVSYGSNLRKKWKCPKGHSWITPIKTRVLGRGCPTCAPYGFDPNKFGYLYLITNENGLTKIGISNTENQRVRQHQNRGWVVKDQIGPISGIKARKFEQEILKALRKQGALFANLIDHGKFDGYTESWITKTFPVENLRPLLTLIGVDDE